MSQTESAASAAHRGAGRVRIRELTHADLPRVVEIENASFSVPWKESTFLNLLGRGDSDLFAADLAGRLVGYAACWTILDQAELGNVAVAEEARRLGVGRLLLEAVVERVWERGANDLFLEVRESNTAAQSVYRQRGFEKIGRRRAYYAQPTEDALVMRLRIGGEHSPPGR